MNDPIQAIDDQIQALYREKKRLEQERDAKDAPALIALLISSKTRFVLNSTHLDRADLLTETASYLENTILEYIGDTFTSNTKPIAGNLHVCFHDGGFYIGHEWTDESSRDRVANLLAALKAIGIPRELIFLTDYENEVANDERNLKRTQADLERVRALVEAY